MKKVFLSIPMKGRTKENIDKSIEKMKAVVTGYLGNDIEFINTIVQDKPSYNTNKEAIWYLGKSVELLSQADVFVCLCNTYEYSGCDIERNIAERYCIQRIVLERDLIAPDILEIEQEKWNPVCCEANEKGE